jgi:ankyrin repeat protein
VEIKSNVLFATDIDGHTAWYVAARYGKLDEMQNLWDLAKENLTKEDIKDNVLLATDCNGQIAWHVTARYCKLDVLQKLLDLAKEILTTEEIKIILLLDRVSDLRLG